MPPKKASKRNSDGDGDARIRNHVNRAGDADDENEYEHVKKGDDESIDDDASEVGWNSDDEHAFHKTTVYRNKKSSKHQDPESEDDIDDDELLQNGGVLLSDLLFQNMSGDNNAKKSLKDESSDSEEDDDEDDESEDDEEGSEMEESDGDNESNSASGTDEDPSSDEGDEDLDDVHNRLLSAIDRFSKPQESSEKAQAGKRHNHQNSAESAYSSLIDNGDVSMNALLGALDDTRGLSVVKKHLADLEKGLAAPVHVEKVVADRMERSQVYTGAQDEMNKWHATVASNRHATTLDLAKDKRQVRSFKSMVNRFVPTTDMEKEIQMVLVQHGATDESNEQNEIDELQGRNLSLQEIREKQAELAKVKALMFYDQMKRHRMNKIKSKAYRKIQKKKKLKHGERHSNGDDLDEEEQDAAREKDAFNRVKERMDMRHKNTSKWAKKALQYGHTDKSLRDAYHESVQLGHDLTQKMNEELGDDSRSVGSASEDEQGGGSGDEEKMTGASARRAVSNRASRAIESLLAENLGSGSADARAAAPDGRYKKLFEMDFMKRAAEQQKEKAREDAQSILREIEAMEEDYDSDLQADEAAEAKKKGPQVSKERLSQAKEEIQSMFGGSGMAMRQGRRKGITVEASSSSSAPFEFASTGADDDEKPEYSDEEEHAAMEAALESNPWLQPVASVGGSKKRKSAGTGAKASAGKDHEEVYINTLEIQSAANGKKNKSNHNATQSGAGTTTSTSNNTGKKNNKKNSQQTSAAAPAEAVSGIVIETKTDSASNAKKEKAAVKISLSEGQTQADLVQMAFAGPDLEAEFHAYKKGEVDAELGLDDKKMKIISDVKAGWGDWAGPGAGGMQISQKVLNKRDQLITKVQKEHDLKVVNRKDSKMMNVMLSNRRIKTSSKYKISEIPHPYTSIEEYERSLQMPLGEEWNSTDVVKNYTQPEIKLRPGRVIEPIKLSKKRNNSTTTGAAVETRLNKPSKKAKK